MFGRTVGAGLLAVSTIALAQTPALPPEKAFGARDAVTGASLSPDGKTMAYLAPALKQGNALFTVPVDGSAQPSRALAASGEPERLTACDWVANDRLVCTVFTLRDEAGFIVGISRQVGVDARGGNVKLVSQRDSSDAIYFSGYGGRVIDLLPGQDGAVLMGRWKVPEVKATQVQTRRNEGLGVERVDTRTIESKTVIAPMNDAREFISDGQGNVRIAGVVQITGDYVQTGLIKYIYRPKGSTVWRDLGMFDSRNDQGFNPYIVDPAEDVAYGMKKENGRLALYKRALDGSNAETKVFAHPSVDVAGPLLLGRKRRVIGAAYSTDRDESVFFDPSMQKLAASLAKALPGNPSIRIQGASDDEQRLLIWAGSDVDPGKYYLLDRATKQMRPLLERRPELAGYPLAPMKSVQVKAADGTLIPAYLTLPPNSTGKNLPALVMPHGGPSSRDDWGFDWLVQYFAQRGYAVLQPNFRGSSGYGDAWFQNNGFQSWRTAIGDVTDSGRWLIAQGIANPAKLAIFGWSYGGYAALQSGVVAPDLFKAIVAVAPVTDLAELKKQYTRTSAQRIIRDFIGSGPHIQEGSPAQNASAIKAPVLMFHGDLDVNVRVVEAKLMEDRLKAAGKSVTLHLYPKLDHGLYDDEARADMLSKSHAFLRTTIGLK